MRVAKRPRRGGDMLIKHDLRPAQPLKQEIALQIPRYKQTNKTPFLSLKAIKEPQTSF